MSGFRALTGAYCFCFVQRSFLSFIVAPACSRVRHRSLHFRPFVCPSVHPSVNNKVESSIKVHFSVVVIAASVKPCIVIVLDILFKHTL